MTLLIDMEASIKGFWENIKGAVGRVLASRDLFPALLLIAVGVASFGLGRLSVAGEVPEAPAAAIEARVSGAVPPAAAPEAVAGGYVASKNSTKYHLPWCSGAQRISEENKIWFASKEEAETAGYTPAGNCEGI